MDVKEKATETANPHALGDKDNKNICIRARLKLFFAPVRNLPQRR